MFRAKIEIKTSSWQHKYLSTWMSCCKELFSRYLVVIPEFYSLNLYFWID